MNNQKFSFQCPTQRAFDLRAAWVAAEIACDLYEGDFMSEEGSLLAHAEKSAEGAYRSSLPFTGKPISSTEVRFAERCLQAAEHVDHPLTAQIRAWAEGLRERCIYL